MAAEHKYTEGNLSFELLKGRDKAMLHLLSTCPDLEARLVLVTHTVTGEAEHDWDDHPNKRPCICWDDGSDEDEWEDDEGPHVMREVCRVVLRRCPCKVCCCAFVSECR